MVKQFYPDTDQFFDGGIAGTKQLIEDAAYCLSIGDREDAERYADLAGFSAKQLASFGLDLLGR